MEKLIVKFVLSPTSLLGLHAPCLPPPQVPYDSFFNLCNRVPFSKYILMLLILHKIFLSDFPRTHPNFDNYLLFPLVLEEPFQSSVLIFTSITFSSMIYLNISPVPLVLFSALWTLGMYQRTLFLFLSIIFLIISILWFFYA